MARMNKLEAGTGLELESILEVRVKRVDSEAEIWRRFELRGSLDLSQIHRGSDEPFDPASRTSPT
jgi:hypothetical protein